MAAAGHSTDTANPTGAAPQVIVMNRKYYRRMFYWTYPSFAPSLTDFPHYCNYYYYYYYQIHSPTRLSPTAARLSPTAARLSPTATARLCPGASSDGAPNGSSPACA